MSESMDTAAPEPGDARPPRRGILVGILIGLGALLLVAIVILAVVLVRAQPPAPDPGAGTPAPTATPSATPTPTATPTASPTPPPPAGPVAVIPGECSELYGPEMWALLTSGFPELNPPDYVDIAEKLTSPQLGAMLSAAPEGLRCSWRLNFHVGVGTRVVPVDAAAAAAVEAELAAAGYTAIDEPWGTRWVIQFADEMEWGESHTVVGGAWLATAWVGTAPDGYTADMVATIVR